MVPRVHRHDPAPEERIEESVGVGLPSLEAWGWRHHRKA
jgi:hypothetical protein